MAPQKAQTADGQHVAPIGQRDEALVAGIEPVAEPDAQQHHAKPGNEREVIDGGIVGGRDTERRKPAPIDKKDGHGRADDNGRPAPVEVHAFDRLADGGEHDPQREVQPLETQERIGQDRRDADEVEDTEVDVADAGHGDDDCDDHAQAKDLEAAPEELGEDARIGAAPLPFAPVDQRERHADQDEKGAGREALPIFPEAFPQHHIGQDAPIPEIPHGVVDDHGDDGDAAHGVDLPEARAGLDGSDFVDGCGGNGHEALQRLANCPHSTTIAPPCRIYRKDRR